jgi:hypothetical protein
MERVEHRIKLNLMKTGLQGQVNVKKADTDSRKVCIYLSYAAKPFDLNDVVSAVLRAEKPDGKVMFNSCTVCEDRLEYIITTQTIAATGTVTCEITLTSNSGQILVTPRFEIIVADVIYSDSEIESTNEYTALEKAIKKASALKDGTTFTPSVSDERRRMASVCSKRFIRKAVSSASKSMIRRYIFVFTSSLLYRRRIPSFHARS